MNNKPFSIMKLIFEDYYKTLLDPILPEKIKIAEKIGLPLEVIEADRELQITEYIDFLKNELLDKRINKRTYIKKMKALGRDEQGKKITPTI